MPSEQLQPAQCLTVRYWRLATVSPPCCHTAGDGEPRRLAQNDRLAQNVLILQLFGCEQQDDAAFLSSPADDYRLLVGYGIAFGNRTADPHWLPDDLSGATGCTYSKRYVVRKGAGLSKGIRGLPKLLAEPHPRNGTLKGGGVSNRPPSPTSLLRGGIGSQAANASAISRGLPRHCRTAVSRVSAIGRHGCEPRLRCSHSPAVQSPHSKPRPIAFAGSRSSHDASTISMNLSRFFWISGSLLV